MKETLRTKLWLIIGAILLGIALGIILSLSIKPAKSKTIESLLPQTSVKILTVDGKANVYKLNVDQINYIVVISAQGNSVAIIKHSY